MENRLEREIKSFRKQVVKKFIFSVDVVIDVGNTMFPWITESRKMPGFTINIGHPRGPQGTVGASARVFQRGLC